MGFHDRLTDCGDTFEEVLSICRGGSREGLDEDDAGVWLLVADIEALDA